MILRGIFRSDRKPFVSRGRYWEGVYQVQPRAIKRFGRDFNWLKAASREGRRFLPALAKVASCNTAASDKGHARRAEIRAK